MPNRYSDMLRTDKALNSWLSNESNTSRSLRGAIPKGKKTLKKILGLLLAISVYSGLGCTRAPSPSRREGASDSLETPQLRTADVRVADRSIVWRHLTEFLATGFSDTFGLFLVEVESSQTIGQDQARQIGVQAGVYLDVRVVEVLALGLTPPASDAGIPSFRAGTRAFIVFTPPNGDGVAQDLGRELHSGDNIIVAPSVTRSARFDGPGHRTAIHSALYSHALFLTPRNIVVIRDTAEHGGIDESASVPLAAFRQMVAQFWGQQDRRAKATEIRRGCLRLACRDDTQCFLGAVCAEVTHLTPAEVTAEGVSADGSGDYSAPGNPVP